MKKLNNKIAIITGSTQGIGEVVTELFYREGATVIITGRNKDKGNHLKEKIIQNGGKAEYIKADAIYSEEVGNLVSRVIREFGKIDILYNNAGNFFLEPPLHELSVEEWDNIINVNLKSVFLFSKYVLPAMIKNGEGSIINTSSVHGKMGYENLSGYNAAKAAIINLTRSMAVSYAFANIRVNCICPGPIYNDSQRRNEAADNPKAEYERWKKIIPLGRLGLKEEVAKLALFLASDESSYITGEYITIDGGLTSKSWTPWDTEETDMIKYSG